MIFRKPATFAEALQSRRMKAILPTSASAQQLGLLDADLRERATFSARTTSARHLAEIDRVVNRVVDPDFVVDPVTGVRRQRRAGEYMSKAAARQELRGSLLKIGYDPDDIDAVPGSLKDLGSYDRLNLIVETNTDMARGYGQWKQGQDKAILDLWPAQELVRVKSRTDRRKWHNRWRNAGGQIYSGVGLDGNPGRLIAKKNDSIWTRISRFGLPYPPFDYRSGVGVRDVRRDEALRLGVVKAETRIEPEERPFNQGLEASLPTNNRGLIEKITSMVRNAQFVDGVLRLS